MVRKEPGLHQADDHVVKKHSILHFFVIIVVMSAWICCIPGSAAASEIADGITTSGISNHTGILWRSAQIDGDRIVWAEHISNTRSVYNIYLYNITTGKEILISPEYPDELHNDYTGGQYPVSISGDRIVWTKHGDVWLYDIPTGKRMALTERTVDLNTAVDHFEPVISGDIVVWSEVRAITNAYHEPDIVAFNLTTGKRTLVATGPFDKSGVRISGSRIVWEDYRKDPVDRDIYLYDMATGQERDISDARGIQSDPKISGDYVVWNDHRDGDWDVHMYDISNGKETIIATGLNEQEAADISGNRIVWMEWPSMLRYNPYDDGNRLMMYDLETAKEYQVQKDVPGMFAPAISGNRIIFMDLAHIPADQRDRQRENTVQEISLFTLDPDVFPLSLSAETEPTITSHTLPGATPTPQPAVLSLVIVFGSFLCATFLITRSKR